MTERIAVLNDSMNAMLLATHHASATGIVELIAGLATAAVVVLFVFVDPKHHQH
ncbi:MAG TPA: hypothetical protein PK020_14685 [Ilumatobacteraceae bacterium]|nr:hypothetical protein [Ilumatobacteraceae bacterium]